MEAGHQEKRSSTRHQLFFPNASVRGAYIEDIRVNRIKSRTGCSAHSVISACTGSLGNTGPVPIKSEEKNSVWVHFFATSWSKKWWGRWEPSGNTFCQVFPAFELSIFFLLFKISSASSRWNPEETFLFFLFLKNFSRFFTGHKKLLSFVYGYILSFWSCANAMKKVNHAKSRE